MLAVQKHKTFNLTAFSGAAGASPQQLRAKETNQGHAMNGHALAALGCSAHD